jgi:alkylation response protein AidB-like acyl-CoA dehydrogenase
VLQAVRRIAQGPLRDAGPTAWTAALYPRDILQQLGAAGAYAQHLGPGAAAGDYAWRCAMAEVSAVCGATGFMVWCQQVCALYLQQSGNPGADRRGAGRTRTRRAAGRHRHEQPDEGLRRHRADAAEGHAGGGGYRVNGTLPWVSNLGPDHYCGTLAAVDTAPGRPREIMFLLRCDAPGVELRNCPSFRPWKAPTPGPSAAATCSSAPTS